MQTRVANGERENSCVLPVIFTIFLCQSCAKTHARVTKVHL